MAAYQTKQFKKWNKKSKIPNSKLLNAVKSIDGGSGIVDLGENLYKIRIAKDKGKRGGYRTIIVHKKGFRSLLVHGYEKSEKEDLSDIEKKFYKNYATDFLGLAEEVIKDMLEAGEIFNLEEKQ